MLKQFFNTILDKHVQDVSADIERVDMVNCVLDCLEEEGVQYCKVLDKLESAQVFIAYSPLHALKWICQRISWRQLVAAITNVYNALDSVVSKGGEEVNTRIGRLKRARNEAKSNS